MNFIIRKASEEDVPVLFGIMNTAAESLEDPSHFAPDDREFIEAHIDRMGFTLIAEADGAPAGFLIVRRPGAELDNLGFDLGLPSCEMDMVWHLESAAVLPEFRGHGLQKLLIREAEKLIEADGSCLYMLATVHPDNAPSRRSLEECGFTLRKAAMKYGGSIRYIMGKKVSVGQVH